jgi:hypothetical protein
MVSVITLLLRISHSHAAEAKAMGEAMSDTLIDPAQVRFVQITPEKTAACS